MVGGKTRENIEQGRELGSQRLGVGAGEGGIEKVTFGQRPEGSED